MAAHRTRLCASLKLFIRIFGVIVWRPEYLTSPAQAVKEYCQRNPVFLFTAGRSEPVWVVAIQNTSPLSQVFVSPGPRERALSEAGFRAISPAFEQPVLASDGPRRLEAPPRFGLTVGIVFKAKQPALSYWFAMALLNSTFAQRFNRLFRAPRFGDLFTETKILHLQLLPTPVIRFTGANSQKRAAAKQFLTDVKEFHGIDARALNPKTELDQFWKLEASELFAYLRKNAKTLAAQNVRLTESDEEKIRARFSKAKEELVPLEARLLSPTT